MMCPSCLAEKRGRKSNDPRLTPPDDLVGWTTCYRWRCWDCFREFITFGRGIPIRTTSLGTGQVRVECGNIILPQG